MQEGLSDNTVLSILKDRSGFMWFGTSNGLSRYDGNIFRNFSFNNRYLQIDEMKEITSQCFALISEEQLYFFNRQLCKYIPFKTLGDTKAPKVRHIYPAVHNHFWAIYSNKLTLFRVSENKDKWGSVQSVALRVVCSLPFRLNKEESLSLFYYHRSNRCFYLISNQGRLFSYTLRSNAPRYITSLHNSLSVPSFTSMIESNGYLWISTVGKGIIRYHLTTGTVDNIRDGNYAHKRVLSHNDVYQILPVGNSRYLAVTWSGYTFITTDRNNPQQYTTEIVENPYSTRHYFENRMLTGYYDSKLRMLWLGTRGGGVNFVDLRLHYYNVTRQTQHNEICGILGDDKHYVWIATFHYGIMKSKAPYQYGKRLEFAAVGPGAEKSGRTILCSFKGHNGILWFGSQNGTLTTYNQHTGQFSVHRLTLPGGTANTSPIWSVLQDKHHRIWVGTERGLFLYNPTNNLLQPLDNRAYFTRSIAETSDGLIWAGTENGLLCAETTSNGKIIITRGYEKSLHNLTDIRSLLASPDGKLYVGYANGLAVVQPKSRSINTLLTTRNGMSNNFVGCIVNDDKGRIWIGNASAISHFSRHQHIFYNYYISGNNRSAMFMDHTLFFGNNRNLTYLYPDEMELYRNKDYRVQLTALKVANRLVGVGEQINGQTILQQDLSASSKIVLSNRNRDFSILFNNLCYSEDMQKYNYRLTPYQKTWSVLNEKGEVSYTNLPEGKYVFEVCCIYPDGSTGKITKLQIVIEPYWTHALWFRLLILLLFVGLTAYLIRYFNLRKKRMVYEMQMKNELLKLNMNWEKERQIRKERENFFTRVAHELRTPLTLILSPLMELLHQTNDDNTIHTQLERMYKNGTSLQMLINQLLYIQKIEAGMVKLQLSEVDLIPIVSDIVNSFRTLTDSQHCTLTTSLSVSTLSIWIDVEKVTSAIQNLISNAFKYTPGGGTISVAIDQSIIDERSYCVLSVSDTGVGIDQKEQEHIFDSFITGVSSPNHSTKIGIGLFIVRNTMELHHGFVKLESKPNKGSTFYLYIPIGKAHFADDSYEIIAYGQDGHKQTQQQAAPEKATINSANNMTNNSSSKPTLLIVEDNIEMRQYLCSLFITRYSIIEAGNGKEGVEAATKHLPTLVITDVMMPVMNGFDCVQIIHNQPQTAHIPILMLTAKAEDVDVLKGLKSGIDDYMMKPFNPEVLKAKVDTLIEQRKRLKHIYTKSLMLKSTEQSSPQVDEFMQQIINRIEAQLSDVNLNVKMLAEQMNMSQPTLFRRLKQHTDLSVIEIIRSIRVSKAATLLMEKRYSIQEISEMVGFNDVRTLRKHFTNKFGVSPSNFADSGKEINAH
jgi:signal transduction histidine kinase/DNA-binding response OmpR family regulator/ligand-binding sensor domain-containing protein